MTITHIIFFRKKNAAREAMTTGNHLETAIGDNCTALRNYLSINLVTYKSNNNS